MGKHTTWLVSWGTWEPSPITEGTWVGGHFPSSPRQKVPCSAIPTSWSKHDGAVSHAAPGGFERERHMSRDLFLATKTWKQREPPYGESSAGTSWGGRVLGLGRPPAQVRVRCWCMLSFRSEMFPKAHVVKVSSVLCHWEGNTWETGPDASRRDGGRQAPQGRGIPCPFRLSPCSPDTMR